MEHLRRMREDVPEVEEWIMIDGWPTWTGTEDLEADVEKLRHGLRFQAPMPGPGENWWEGN